MRFWKERKSTPFSPMTRPIRRAPPRRAKSAPRLLVLEADATPRILSDEEKRGLILAHAKHHRSRPQKWGLGYAVGLVASCLVVAFGWFLTLDTNLHNGWSTSPDPSWTVVKDRLHEMKDDARARTSQEVRAIQQLQGQYKTIKQQAASATSTLTPAPRNN